MFVLFYIWTSFNVKRSWLTPDFDSYIEADRVWLRLVIELWRSGDLVEDVTPPLRQPRLQAGEDGQELLADLEWSV